MPSEKHISSSHNPEIRQLQHWTQKSRDRRKAGRFVLEGLRELGLALEGGYTAERVYYCPEILEAGALERLPQLHGVPRTTLSPEVYRQVAYRGKTEGVLAVMHAREHSLDALEFKRKSPLILIAEAPEKPGNVGALLRTADAAGLDAVIIADPRSDLYNPNVIRSSVGCLFTVPVAVASTAETLAYLEQEGIHLMAACLGGATRYDQADYRPPTAIAVGTEATGLTEAWRQQAKAKVEIPMAGAIDSMNVSVSAAILVFEALRQRGFDPA
ncbi:RNA methyltransferase [Robiginitalea sp. M366]|uniref:TrmH family RNA methyltransferase n=1 Tax=Robiginitalea aestuariiviva TaxID=3036903 RepID=UPI00240D57B4|nr:RNA methyltransferase [Robiginitalea aestuariiviva]MDG1573231.1 RNA methyltransferase [Robiginitalea aestuariiviva]